MRVANAMLPGRRGGGDAALAESPDAGPADGPPRSSGPSTDYRSKCFMEAMVRSRAVAARMFAMLKSSLSMARSTLPSSSMRCVDRLFKRQDARLRSEDHPPNATE